MLIGREQEQEMLHKAYESDSSQFVAVYGRRRVGKTYLVRECFADKFVFQHSGVAKASTKLQLRYFKESLLKSGFPKARMPKDWIEAFSMLEQLIEQSEVGKKVVFIDEIPWMDTPRSNFITALEYFWNSFASARKDVLLIVYNLSLCTNVNCMPKVSVCAQPVMNCWNIIWYWGVSLSIGLCWTKERAWLKI